jgi:O-antigen ligase
MDNFKQYTQIEKWVFTSIFLVLACLLSTNNGSVAIAGLTAITSIVFLYRHRSLIHLDNTDKLVIGVLSAYLLANVPLVIIDWDNMRYFRGASRIILCIPIYIFFKYVVDVSKVYVSGLSWGLFLGSIGAFSLACYQYFYEGRPRVDGFLYSINFGYLACAMIVLSLSLLNSKLHRNILSIAIVLSSFSLITTMTRGAIFVVPIIFVLIYILNYKKIGIRLGLLGLGCLTAISIGLYTVSDSMRERIDFTVAEMSHIANGEISKSVSSGGRITLWIAAIEAFQKKKTIIWYDAFRKRNSQ